MSDLPARDPAPTPTDPSGASGTGQETRVSRLGPLHLDWKVNVTAVAAFILSLVALSQQTFGYLKGANVTLHRADKVYLYAKGPYLHAGTRMVYTNDGATGYNALVFGESVLIRAGGREIEEWAEGRGRFAVEDKQLRLGEEVDAAPFLVPATQLVTHDSDFSPRESPQADARWKNYLKRQEFVDLLARARSTGADSLDLVFRATSRQISGLHAGRELGLSTTCTITLDDGLVQRMRNEGWTARTCRKP